MEWNIEEGEFHALDGTVQNAAMLMSCERRYLSNEHAYGFLKAYRNCDYSFMALLPRHTRDPREMLAAFGEGDLAELLNNPVSAAVHVTMPEFAFEGKTSVKRLLTDRGVVSVFDPDAADIRGLTDLPNTYVGDILQKARIEVNRNGTRAAAVTMMYAVAGAAPQLDYYEVTLDRPFVFGIIENQTGIPYFLGVVNRL